MSFNPTPEEIEASKKHAAEKYNVKIIEDKEGRFHFVPANPVPEWEALPLHAKRELTRKLLEAAFGIPITEQRAAAIEEVVNRLYPDENHE
jgi:hypothetical protein